MVPHRERLPVSGNIVRTHQPGAVLHTGQMHGERARHAILGPLDTGEHADEPLARRAHHHRVPERHQLVEPASRELVVALAAMSPRAVRMTVTRALDRARLAGRRRIVDRDLSAESSTEGRVH